MEGKTVIRGKMYLLSFYSRTSLSLSLCSHGDEPLSDLQLRDAIEKLKENEKKYEEVEKQKMDIESKYSEANRKALSLQRHKHEYAK